MFFSCLFVYLHRPAWSKADTRLSSSWVLCLRWTQTRISGLRSWKTRVSSFKSFNLFIMFSFFCDVWWELQLRLECFEFGSGGCSSLGFFIAGGCERSWQALLLTRLTSWLWSCSSPRTSRSRPLTSPPRLPPNISFVLCFVVLLGNTFFLGYLTLTLVCFDVNKRGSSLEASSWQLVCLRLDFFAFWFERDTSTQQITAHLCDMSVTNADSPLRGIRGDRGGWKPIVSGLQAEPSRWVHFL